MRWVRPGFKTSIEAILRQPPLHAKHSSIYEYRAKEDLHMVTLLPEDKSHRPKGVVVFHHGFTDHSRRHTPGKEGQGYTLGVNRSRRMVV